MEGEEEEGEEREEEEEEETLFLSRARRRPKGEGGGASSFFRRKGEREEEIRKKGKGPSFLEAMRRATSRTWEGSGRGTVDVVTRFVLRVFARPNSKDLPRRVPSTSCPFHSKGMEHVFWRKESHRSHPYENQKQEGGMPMGTNRSVSRSFLRRGGRRSSRSKRDSFHVNDG